VSVGRDDHHLAVAEDVALAIEELVVEGWSKSMGLGL
jgi:hypothetical protein